MRDIHYEMLNRMEAKIDQLIHHAAADHERLKGLERFRAWTMKIAGTVLAAVGTAYAAMGGHHGL